MRARLIELHAELAEQLAYLLVICLQALGELFRRFVHGVVRQGAHLRGNTGIAHRLPELGVQLIDDCPGGSRRCKDADPCGGFVAREGFRDRRHARELLHPLQGRYPQRTRAIRLDMLDDIADSREHGVDSPRSSLTVGPPPLNGTWVTWMPVEDSRITVFRWMKLP